jgi:hypothetical protein
MPGMLFSSPRNFWTSWSAESFRWDLGFNRRKTTPELPPPLPTLDINEAISGCFCKMALTAFWCSTIESNDIPFRKPNICRGIAAKILLGRR